MKPFDEVVETDLLAGNFIIELIENDEAFARDDWGADQGAVRVQLGRVGLHSVDELHYPEIRLSSFETEPTHALADELGSWPVVFRTGQVEIWGGEADPGEHLLKLPKSPGGRYLMRVAVWRKLVDEQEVFDYTLECAERDGEPTHDLERFTVDFWAER